jgi:3-hydroxybutyryl-CoA dehydratase
MEAAGDRQREVGSLRDSDGELIMIERGQIFELVRTFTQEDFDRFAELSGDDNPIHVDEDFAKTTRFGRTLCHGMLLFSAASAVIRNHLPGPGTVIIDQALKFPGPTFAGDECRIRIEVLSISPDRRRAGISTSISKADGTTCLEGQAEVLLP